MGSKGGVGSKGTDSADGNITRGEIGIAEKVRLVLILRSLVKNQQEALSAYYFKAIYIVIGLNFLSLLRIGAYFLFFVQSAFKTIVP